MSDSQIVVSLVKFRGKEVECLKRVCLPCVADFLVTAFWKIKVVHVRKM
jgi:hypothetical protein